MILDPCFLGQRIKANVREVIYELTLGNTETQVESLRWCVCLNVTDEVSRAFASVELNIPSLFLIGWSVTSKMLYCVKHHNCTIMVQSEDTVYIGRLSDRLLPKTSSFLGKTAGGMTSVNL